MGNKREMFYGADSIYKERWSPRAFSEKPVSEEDLKIMIEAARWAPSCYNTQPWRFFCAVSDEARARVLATLVQKNQLWAIKAPVLMYVIAKKQFEFNERENWWATFDSGAAWYSFAQQAQKLGIATHAMAGFDKEKAYKVTGLPKHDYEIIAVVAIGYSADPETLDEEFRKTETPNERIPTDDLAFFV